MTHVLVIDDDKSICMSLEIWLRHQGCAATLANSGRVGTELFESFPFDLVMVDIFMPGMDGIETIKCFRARSRGVPIIAMSGFMFRNSSSMKAPNFLTMATQLGASSCLRKPFGPQQLRAAIRTCLGDRLGQDHSPSALNAFTLSR
jgi:DNA-binding response OmpR family regulator